MSASTIDVCRNLYPWAVAWREAVFLGEQIDGEVEHESCLAELAAIDAFLERCRELGLDRT
jgi:hypothetical protein